MVNPLKQASLGFAKGVSKIGGGLTIVSDSVLENAGKIFRTNGNNNNRMNINLNKDTNTFSLVEDTQAEVNRICFSLEGNVVRLECEKYSTSCASCYYG